MMHDVFTIASEAARRAGALLVDLVGKTAITEKGAP
jgi:hypothetical protein